MLSTMFSGCKNIKGQSKRQSYLSDLGGVYSSDIDDIDFSLEVSGRLTEAEYASADTESGELPVETSLVSENSGRDKIRSWGIRRKEGNQPPDADPGAPELLKKYNSLYIGDTSKKVVYLTFDEGYENGYTPKILDVLHANNTKAAFFITGPYLKQHQDLVRRMVEEGHIVGNHTIHHPSLPTISDYEIEEEVLGLDRAFREKFGKSMKYLRPPKGEYSERTLELTSKLGYRNVFWSFAYDDWYRDKIRGPQYAYDIVMRNLHNGAIILLHAVSKDNADALDMIIKGIKERGYTIGTLDDIE
ncbi:MAG TPA: delta-lactam-biosynthetic de-N-acetylase [Clostridiaceae bacterium]|nr:delta-lactam-biosynthetic de-N-acetylase [Clostridiaceae bacterium]